jgi:hypothetical protein
LLVPSAFDDLCRRIDRCADLGSMVELPLRHPNQVDLPALKKASEATGLEIPSLSSGRVFAAHRSCFTQREAEIREAIQRRQYGMYEP